MVNVVLVEPEIPPNTGNIARFCAAMRCPLHLVQPLGFSLDEKHLKRAGMDYWKQVDVTVWNSSDEFFEFLDTEKKRFFLLSTKASQSYTEVNFKINDFLVFGRETKGLPESLLKANSEQSLTIPMLNPESRSLNLASAASIVTFEALRQLKAV
ncbi:MAG: tRNA (cytidine(34)-2'-O)-methyltransferase [Verrucomicrobiota bacterium]